jgi:hypothetical protein
VPTAHTQGEPVATEFGRDRQRRNGGGPTV